MAFYPSPVSIIHVQVLKWCQVAENSGARRRCRSWCHDASQVQPVHFPSAPDTPHRQQRSSSWCTTAWVFKNIHLFTELALPNSCCHYITIMHLNILYICIQSPAFAHTDSRNSAALSWAILSAHSCQTMRRSSLKPSLLNSMPVEVPRPWMSKPCFQVFALRWMWAWMASCFLHSCYKALANPSQLMSKIKCICWHKSPLTYPQIIKAKMASVHLGTKSRFFLGSFNEVPVWIQIVH